MKCFRKKYVYLNLDFYSFILIFFAFKIEFKHIVIDKIIQMSIVDIVTSDVKNPLHIPRSKHKTPKLDLNEDFEFLPIDWYECDIEDINVPRKGYYLNCEHNKSYGIFVFGVTSTGESVCLKLNNYFPYFYIQVPDDFNDIQAEDLKNAFSMENIEKTCKNDIEEAFDDAERNQIKFMSKYYKTAIKMENCTFEKSQIFWSFMNGQLFRFLKISTVSKNSIKFLTRYLKEEVDLEIGNKVEPIKYLQFESDLDILLRFFHDAKIQPSNWIKIPGGCLNRESRQSKCQINLSCNWNDLVCLDKTEIPPIIVASFDIEADSSHGDFPLARKDCKKLANQLVITWIRDATIIKKEKKKDNSNPKYNKAIQNHNLGAKFFDYRIKQAIGFPIDEDKKDDDIDLIYLKMINFAHILQSEAYYDMTKLIHKICSRSLVKVKADTKVKKAVNTVMERQDKIIESNGYITYDDFVDLIETVAKNEKIDVDFFKNKILTKDIMVRFVNQELNRLFGYAEGDKVIQIGTVFWRYGETKPFHNNIITLKGCASFKVGDKDCEVIAKNDEYEVLAEWSKLIRKYDPDIITGYNIFGFDESFLYDRLLELVGNFTKRKITNEDIRILQQSNDRFNKFINLTRLTDEVLMTIPDARGKLNLKQLSSSALGENYLYYFNMPGRVQIDLLKVCQASMDKLPSYKLDDVAEHYISGDIFGFNYDDEYDGQKQSRYLHSKNIKELEVGNFIIISMKTTGQKLYDGEKLKIINIDRTPINDKEGKPIKNTGIVEIEKPIDKNCLETLPQWGIGKDDVSPKDIFRLQKGSDYDRSIIAKYCIQDCALLIRLIQRLDTIPNNFGMSNVCLVPFSYIFMRGQGIKIFSLIVNECSNNNYKLPVLEKVEPEEVDLDIADKPIASLGNIDDDDDEKKKKKYEDKEETGNTVFQLKNDFNVIKMTQDSYEGAIVLTPKPNIYTEPITVLDFSSLYPSEMIANDLSHDRICEDQYWLGKKGAKRIKKLGLDYVDIEYDNFAWIDPNNHNKGKKKIGVNVTRFIVDKKEKGLLSRILMKLLDARKATKKRIKTEPDPNKATILDGLQLAYKLTANSLYGQCGARTSKIFKKAIAASCTAGGRKRIYTARDYCLENNPGCDVVYGDTDSVFVKFNLQYDDGTYPQTDLEKIQRSMDIGLAIQQKLKDDKVFPHPHDLEYEKVFYPLILITKKRYIGMKYEFDPKKGKKTSMGVVTKRRDNAPILKHSFIGVTDTIMKEKNIPKSIQFIKDVCYDMINDKFELNMFIISKTLREYYKDPESIAHKVLADRMTERDPGNKPSCNERLPYIYIKIDEQPGISYLQGDRIEHVNYVRENDCQVDYETYITNQIMKPVSQIFELVIDRIPGYPYDAEYFDRLEVKYYNKYDGDLIKTAKKISELKHKLIRKLIFEEILVYAYNKIHNVNTIDNYFTVKKADKDKIVIKKVNKSDVKSNDGNSIKTLEIKKLKQGSIFDFLE